MPTDPEFFEYKWTGPYANVIGRHTTPDGTGVKAHPGKNFKTIAPVIGVAAAVPVSANAKAAAKEAEAKAAASVEEVTVPEAKSVAAAPEAQEATQ